VGKFKKYINFSIFSNIIIFNSLAGCKNKEGGNGGCSYCKNKDNNDINRDDDNKENDDDKKKKEEEDNKKEEEDKAKEEQLKQQQAELENKKNYIKSLLKEVIDSNNELPEKDRIEIKIKEKDIDDCKDIKSLNNIFKELNGIKTQIFNKATEVKKELAKQILLNKRNKIIEIFDEVYNLINKIKQRTSNEFIITITEDEIKKKEKIEELNNIESDLEKQKQELTKLYKKLTTDTPICKTKDEFITKFNERKNELISKNYFKNNDLNNKLKADLESAESTIYFIRYRNMTKDIFTHEIALDLQIYRYILKLEGFIDALDKIFKQKVQYDFFTFWLGNQTSYSTTIYKKNNEYFLDFNSSADFYKNKIEGNYSEYKDIYNGIFYVDNTPLKYVRCNEGCKNGENCISCKLRNLLEKENIDDLYKKLYEGYGDLAEEKGTLRPFIFSNIKEKFRNKKNFFFTPNNEKAYNFYDYEQNIEKINEKKCYMFEWVLTIELIIRFRNIYNSEKKFFLYRTCFFGEDNVISKSQLLDSTSLIGPCYFYSMRKFTILNKIEANIYCCFFNHIINPFSNEEKYGYGVKEKFLNCKLKGDYECEIGYIPVNQKYIEEVKCELSKPGEIEKIQNYIYERTIENFKQNMLNGPTTKTSKLHVFKDDKIIDLK